MPAYTYNANPTSRTGQGVYGRVPGSIGVPQPARDLRNRISNLDRLNSSIADDIYQGSQAHLSTGTLADLKDFNTSWAVENGLPYNAGLRRNREGRDIGRAAQDLVNTAIGQYNSFVPTVSGTQTVSPALQTQIAEQNSLNNAAPDPTQAGSHAERLFREYQNRNGFGGGGGGGGVSRGGGGPSTWNPADLGGGPNEVVGLSTGTGLTVGGGNVIWPGGTMPSRFYGGGAGPSGSGSYYAGQSYGGLTPDELWEDNFWNGTDVAGGGTGGAVQPQGGDQGTGE